MSGADFAPCPDFLQLVDIVDFCEFQEQPDLTIFYTFFDRKKLTIDKGLQDRYNWLFPIPKHIHRVPAHTSERPIDSRYLHSL